MFASKNGPDISHLFLIVDHLGHILERVDILKPGSKQVIQDFVKKNKLKKSQKLRTAYIQNDLSLL